ncbi:MAG TPA: DinB family protein [Thermomicrobiaceae bacterium]|nr:DinB family protein [Thermomicrobiaceae bacterium]
MDAGELLRNQAATADHLMTQIIGPVTPEQARWHPADSAANPIAKTYLHVYISQDRLVHRLQGQPPLLEQGWHEKLGFNPDQPWYQQAEPDLDTARAYAAEVQQATQPLLANLPDELFTRELDMPFGRTPAVNALATILVTHKMMHGGEIAGLLGVQGVKGLPF